MIPKIIHYCWFGSDIPESIQRNIDKWKSVMPDYEFIQWDSSRFPREKLLWVDQACDNHKYAFAADYVRLYALYEYGGIYLDTDVEVLKSFDPFLNDTVFFGFEELVGFAVFVGFGKNSVETLESLFRRVGDALLVGAERDDGQEHPSERSESGVVIPRRSTTSKMVHCEER